jgi:hypothetical protein
MVTVSPDMKQVLVLRVRSPESMSGGLAMKQLHALALKFAPENNTAHRFDKSEELSGRYCLIA